MKTKFLNSMTRSLSKVGIKVKKHSPEILVVAGITGVVASTVMACKATTKVGDIIADTNTKIEQVRTVLADSTIPAETYSAEDGKKDLVIIRTQSAIKFVKLYAPAVLLGAASITCILASNNILRKRNVAIAAAYATVDKGFKDYRGRVIDRFGKELDRELRYNVKAKTVEETVVDENGKETTQTKTVNTVDDNVSDHSDFARFFDESCPGWTKDAEYNLMFLRRQQDFANRKLQEVGYLFLNDVYEMIGLHKTKAGQIVGWVYNEKNPSGDNYVDFGIYDYYKLNDDEAERKRAFVNGLERVILLDFNVDGNILDLI